MANPGKGKNNGGRSSSGGQGITQPPRNPTVRISQPLTIRQEATTEDNDRYRDDNLYKENTLKTARRLNKITILGAILSIVGLYFVYKNLEFTGQATQASVDQAKTAREEFQNSQRPWVSLRIANAQLIFRGDSVLIDPAVAKLHNYGQSVARNVMFIPYLVLNEEDDGKQCNRMNTSFKPPPNVGLYPYGQVIFPTETVDSALSTFKKGPLTDIQRSGLRLVACVVYTSPIDDVPHHTRVVYRLDTTEPNVPIIRDHIYHLALVMDMNGTSAD